jgi:hypothetical protein
VAEPFGGACLEGGREERVEKAWKPASQLALGKRMQAQDAHPTGERVRELWDEEYVGGSGQDESARDAPPIDRELERREQCRHALYLVEDRAAWQFSHEAHGISLRGCSSHVIVERVVAVATTLAHHPRERRLAALSGSVNQDHRRVVERLAQAGGQEPGDSPGGWHGQR